VELLFADLTQHFPFDFVGHVDVSFVNDERLLDGGLLRRSEGQLALLVVLVRRFEAARRGGIQGVAPLAQQFDGGIEFVHDVAHIAATTSDALFPRGHGGIAAAKRLNDFRTVGDGHAEHAVDEIVQFGFLLGGQQGEVDRADRGVQDVQHVR